MLKTISIPRQSVNITLIVRSNMSCINVLGHTDDFSMNRKFGVYLYASLKSLLHLSDFIYIYIYIYIN